MTVLKSQCLGLTPRPGPRLQGASLAHHLAPRSSLFPNLHPSHASQGQQTPATEKKQGDNRAGCSFSFSFNALNHKRPYYSTPTAPTPENNS